MKKMMILAVLAVFSVFAEQWRTDVPTGYFNDPNNWTGGVVAVNGARGYIQGANKDYTFLFPTQGYEENGYTGLNNFGPSNPGNWITFDVRNSWWRKGPGLYPSDWECFLFKQGGGSHLFNIENVSKTAPARPVFFWTNALFRSYISSTSVTNIFESGTFNFYNPGTNGEASANSLFIGNSGPSTQWTLIRASSKTIFNNLNLRSVNTFGSTVYEGGEHEIRGGLKVKADFGGWVTGKLDVAGNTLLKTYGTITVGSAVNGNGLMTIKDDATLTMNGNQLYLASVNLSTGIVTVAGSGKLLGLSGTADIYIGNAATNRGILNLQDTGTIALPVSGGTVFVANNSLWGRGYLNMDGGVFAATNNVMELRGDTAEVNLNAGSSYFKEIRLTGRTQDAQTVVNVRGGEHRIGSGGLNIGNGTNRSAVVIVSGGKLYSTVSEVRVGYGAASEGTNVFRQTGGEVILSNRSVYVASSTGSRGRVELLGGTLMATRINGGAGAAANGSTGFAQLLADGGTFNYYYESGGSTNPIAKLDSAVLGAAGLTYDDGGFNTVISQAFTDAAGVSGLFTKNGAGKLTLQQNSSHASTVINGGSLVLPAGVSQFGRSLTLNGVTLEMNTSDTITADTFGGSGTLLRLSNVLTAGTYTLFKSAGDPTSFKNSITLLGTSVFRNYTWNIVPVEGVNELRLTIEVLPDAVTYTWSGAQDMTWGTSGNWSPDGVPALQDYAVFAGANPGTVSIPSGSGISRVSFDSASAYTLEGGPLMIAESIEAVSGSHEVAAPISTVDGGQLTVDSAAAVNLSGSIAGIQTDIVKTGSGSAALTGANTFSGSIFQKGGILSLEGAGAFGAAKPATNGLVLTAGTVQYGGADGTVARGFSVGTGDGLVAAMFNTVKNLTLTGVFNTFSGVWIKRGAGVLSLEPSAGGTHKLTAANGASGSNTYPSGDLVFPADGSSPSAGFAGLTIAEGTLKLKGSASTIFDMRNVVAVGARTVGSETANAAMEIDGCRVNQGGSGLHLLVGHDLAAGHSNTNPALRIVNGGYLDINGAILGNSGSQKFAPELTMDGAGTTFSCFFSISFGSGNVNVYPRVRLANGARLQSRGQWESWGGAGGIFFKSPTDFIADGGSIVDQYQHTGETIFNNYAAGQLLFRGGSIFRHGRLYFRNYGASGAVELTFDNGIWDPQGLNTSYVCRATQQGVRVLDGGVSLNVSDGMFHRCGLPIRGTGNLVKTGSGTAVFGQAIEFQSNGTTNWVTGIPTAQYTGRTLIQQGTVALADGGMIPTGKVSVASGALLDLSGLPTTLTSIAGGGTVTNGTLTAKYEFSQGALLNLADVSAATFTVDFGRADDDPMPAGKIAIATLSGATKPTVTGWKTVNAGRSYAAVYSVEDDTVYADIKFVGGTRIILR